MSANYTTTAALSSGWSSNYSSNTSAPVTTNTRLVKTDAVAASSVGANSTSSFVASTSGSASVVSASATISGSVEKNGAAAGLVAKPMSWKYGVAIGAVVAGSFVLGSGI